MTYDVANVAELRRAVKLAAVGDTIRLVPGTYRLRGPLILPVDRTLKGAKP